MRREPTQEEFKHLNALCDASTFFAYQGWREPRYFKIDPNVEFECIEFSSTGIHKAIHMEGDSPCQCWIVDGGDLWPSRPILMREIK